MSASDPLRTVWAALARAGCAPHGHPSDFRARCPAHNGDNGESLHVGTGGDGRALVHCFTCGASAHKIVARLGLTMADLFPAGHHRARRRHLQEARRRDFDGNARELVNVLHALARRGADWHVELRCDCPYCGSPAALLSASDRGIFVSCPGDEHADGLGFGACTFRQFSQALAGMLDDQDAA